MKEVDEDAPNNVNKARGIPNKLYTKLRVKTPSQEIRELVNRGKIPPYDDPALPGLQVTERLDADHIVPVKQIIQMDGFDKLSLSDQLRACLKIRDFGSLALKYRI